MYRNLTPLHTTNFHLLSDLLQSRPKLLQASVNDLQSECQRIFGVVESLREAHQIDAAIAVI